MALPNPSPGDSVAAAHIDSIRTHLEGGAGDTAPYKLRQSTGDFIVVLADNAGASELSVHDSDDVEVAHVDSNGAATFNSLTITNLDIPVSASPAQTADGRAVWDSDDDLLTIGDGSSRKTFYPGRTPVVVIKTADQTVNNSTTLVNDSLLKSTLAVSTRYAFECFVVYDSSAVADIKVAFTVPAAATIHYSTIARGATLAVAYAVSNASAGTIGIGADAAGTFASALIIGHVSMSTTAGDLQLQWAQNTAEVSDTIMKAGSWLRVERT